MAFSAFVMFFMSVAGLLWINEAQALRISMKRIIFEGPKRSDIITIMNNTAQEQTYRLGWRRYRMDEKRSLVVIPEGDPAAEGIQWADKMIRFAPRRVTVPPGGSQQVRLLLRRPRDLEQGEYRSHLWIITEIETAEFSEQEKAKPGQQAFRLTMQPALTLPVFVRHGDLKASAKMTDAKLTRTELGAEVSFVLHREGDRSLYGDLRFTCVAGGQEYDVHRIRGIAVYTEVNKRFFDMDVKFPPERANDCSRIRVEYIADKSDILYAGEVMAQAVASP